MNRYVAMFWDAAEPASVHIANKWRNQLQRRSSNWCTVLDAPGIRVLSYIHRGNTPIVTHLADGSGIIIGPLFRRGRESKGRIKRLDNEQAAHIAASRGDTLVSAYWGNYVAIWRNAASQITIVRDPCGAVPCFITTQKGATLLFAHAEDVADFEGLAFDIDWDYLRAFILFQYFITKHTGLKQVTEVLSGGRMEFSVGEVPRHSWAWHGAEIAAHPTLQSFTLATEELRATAAATLVAWGNEYRAPIVSLSGGLDSSILLCLLRRVVSAQIFAHHYVGVEYENYEAKLARLVAQHANVPLCESVMDPTKDDAHDILAIPRIARPAVQTMAILADQLAAEFAERADADAFFTGQGGDNLFLQRGGAKHTLADYISMQGFGLHTLQVAYDAAMLRRTSVFDVYADALRTHFKRDNWHPFLFLADLAKTRQPLISQGVTDNIPEGYISHDWIDAAGSLPRGKAEHLFGIMALYRYYSVRGHGISRDVILPFFSQPLTEFALRTPTYSLCQGGEDRALQRRAFGHLIPHEVLRRTSKGGIDVYLSRALRRNLPFYRSMMLAGSLSKTGWLDNAAIEQALGPEQIMLGHSAMSLYTLIAVEAWLRSWQQTRTRPAAS